jgi:hypothetical protein
MVNVAWPPSLKPSDFGYFHLESDTSGGRSMGGGEQFIASPGARWGATMTLPIRGDADVLTVRALRSKLQGRANPAILPNFDGRRLSWPIEAATGRVITPRVAHQLAGTYGLENTSYAGPVIPPAAQINATMEAAAVRATQVAITVTQGGPLKEGQQFGIASQRLYEISAIVSVVGAETTAKIWPPLRAAATLGTAVQFTRAYCLMRCENLSDELRALESLRYATLNLSFVEYL